MHSSRSIDRCRALERSFGVAMSLWLAACSAGSAPSLGTSSARDPQTASGATAALDDYVDAGMVTRGAGMPNVPIHRADAGANVDADVPPMQGSREDAGSDAAAGPVPGVDAGQGSTDAKRDAGNTLPPAAAPPQPVRRFSFSGAGVSAPDLAGGAESIVHGNAVLDGAGAVSFPGQGDGFVELPDDLLEGMTSFTVLVWLSVRSSDTCGQRAFDVSSAQPSSSGASQASLFLSPYGCSDGLPMLGYSASGDTFELLGEAAIAQQAGLVQLGGSFSARSQTLRLIVDGTVQEEQSVPVDVRTLERAAGTLGRSSLGNPQLHGAITELRVYDSRLEPEALQQIYARGPDAL
jgi:hypothetical protein